MDTSSKNRLQEYCMKNRFNFPSYRIRIQSGPSHAPRFQVEVEVNGQWYVGDDLCSSKRQAEQSAANKALEAIVQNDVRSISSDDLDPPPPYSEVVKSNAIQHLPPEYADIENYISIAVKFFGGRVRKIFAPNSDGLYKFEINGSYRYCDNIGKHHRRNQIYFMVDPINKTYYQMCHDPDCHGFRSRTRQITIKRPMPANEEKTDSVDQYPTLTKDVK